MAEPLDHPSRLVPIELDPAEHAPDEQARARRWQRLREQRDARGYTLFQPPEECRELDRLDSRDDVSPAAIEEAFREALSALPPGREDARGRGAYRHSARHLDSASAEDRRLSWIAHFALAVFADRGEPERARPYLEQAHEALQDPAWRHLLRCDLARLEEEQGRLDEADAWLATCDKSPPLLELDSAYRVGVATVAMRRGQHERALQALGEEAGTIPTARAYLALEDLLRVAALEHLGRQDEADAALEAVVETHLVVDLHDLVARRPALASCRQSWQLFCDRKDREAAAQRKAGLRAAGVWLAFGVLGIPLAIAIVSAGTVRTLRCERPVDGPGEPVPTCVIDRTLAGSHQGTDSVTGLKDALVNRHGSGTKARYHIELVTASGTIDLGGCQTCEDAASEGAKRVRGYLRDKSVRFLRVEEPGTNAAPVIGLLVMMLALALIGLGAIRAVKAVAIRSNVPRL